MPMTVGTVETFIDAGCSVRQFCGEAIDLMVQLQSNCQPGSELTRTDAGVVYPAQQNVVCEFGPRWQFDVKLDHQINRPPQNGGRTAGIMTFSPVPTVIGSDQGDGVIYSTNVQNGGVEYIGRLLPPSSDQSLQRGPGEGAGQTNN